MCYMKNLDAPAQRVLMVGNSLCEYYIGCPLHEAYLKYTFFTLGFMILGLPADRSRANFQDLMCINCTSHKGQCGQCCCFAVNAAEAPTTAAAAVFVVKYYFS